MNHALANAHDRNEVTFSVNPADANAEGAGVHHLGVDLIKVHLPWPHLAKVVDSFERTVYIPRHIADRRAPILTSTRSGQVPRRPGHTNANGSWNQNAWQR